VLCVQKWELWFYALLLWFGSLTKIHCGSKHVEMFSVILYIYIYIYICVCVCVCVCVCGTIMCILFVECRESVIDSAWNEQNILLSLTLYALN